MRDSWITEEQWTQLDAARQLRPKATGALTGCAAIALGFCATIAVFLSIDRGMSPAYAVGWCAGFLAIIWLSGRQARLWVKRFNGTYAPRGHVIATLTSSAMTPTLQYEAVRNRREWECLRIKLTGATGLSIQSAGRPLGDAEFDRVLGVDGTSMQRILLGGLLRTQLPGWYARSKLTVDDRWASLHIGALGFETQSAEIDAICAGLQAYVDRLSAPPMAGLARLAVDLTHSFDAARALSTLANGWAKEAERICVLLAEDPVGAVLARVATTGEGLLDPALDARTRSAIGRGVLGASGPAHSRFIRWLRAQIPSDEHHAMLLIELCDAAYVLLEEPAFKAQADVAVQYLVDHGGLMALGWMRMYLKHARQSLNALNARLQSERGGLLSLDEDALSGGLSEARGGELSPASRGPESAYPPDPTATDS